MRGVENGKRYYSILLQCCIIILVDTCLKYEKCDYVMPKFIY